MSRRQFFRRFLSHAFALFSGLLAGRTAGGAANDGSESASSQLDAQALVKRLADPLAKDSGATMVGYHNWSVHKRLEKVRYPEEFGASTDAIDNTNAFNLMYAASAEEGFTCSSSRGHQFRVDGEVGLKGAVISGGRTDFYLSDNAARIRVHPSTQATNLYIQTRPKFAGSAVYLNGLDDWGTEFRHQVLQNVILRNRSPTGVAVHFDCNEPLSRIAYVHMSGFKVAGFDKALFMHSGAQSDWSFITANTISNFMAGSGCRTFIDMFADPSAGGVNSVGGNKLISFDFQNKNDDRALHMRGLTRRNTLIGHAYFDLSVPDSVLVEPDSQHNFIQGMWLQSYENISNDNIVLNFNASDTYKSYFDTVATHAKTFGHRGREVLPPNTGDVTVNRTGFWETSNTSDTTYARFRGLRDGEMLNILCNDEHSYVSAGTHISIPGQGGYSMKMHPGQIYQFTQIGSLSVMQMAPKPYVRPSEGPSTASVKGWSAIEPISENTDWIQITAHDGNIYRVPAWRL